MDVVTLDVGQIAFGKPTAVDEKNKPGLSSARQAGFGEFSRRVTCADTSSLAWWQVMVVVMQWSGVKIHNGAKVQAGLLFFQTIFLLFAG